MTDTPEKRAYAVRLACGDGWKNAMPMADFATLLNKKSKGAAYDSAKISRIESGGRTFTIADAKAYAAVDPMRRGAAWVAMLDEPKSSGADLGIAASPEASAEQTITEITPPTAKKATGGGRLHRGK